MGAFRTNWLGHVGRNTTHYLFKLLVEQHAFCLSGASSSLALICRQVINTNPHLGEFDPSQITPDPRSV